MIRNLFPNLKPQTMKKLSLILALLICYSISLQAQTDKRNVVKFFPTSVLFGKATFGYERVLSSKTSFTLNLGLTSGIEPLSYAPEISTPDFNLLSGKLSGKLVMPGFRFNFSQKGAPIGFFIETYLKYESFDLDFNAEVTQNINEKYSAALTGDYSGMGGGIQMGVQFLIAKRVTLEWSILGIEAKSATASITVTDLAGNMDIDDLFGSFEADFSDIPLIGKSLGFEKSRDSVTAKASNFILPGLRTAFSIGISF